jgi:hypothetical protein
MARLDDFTRAYVEAALWSSNDEDDDPLDENYGIDDIDPVTLEAMERECANFQEKYSSLIEDDESPAIDKWGRWELAGHDFWLTSAGHGAGFGDGNFPKHDDELYEAAESYPGFELYVGSDGVIYAVGHEPPRGVKESRRPILRPRPAREARRRLRPRYAGESDLPTKNVYWRDIPPGSRVELVGHSYVVTLPDGTRASAYWGGQDARAAQRALDNLVAAGQHERTPLRSPSRRSRGR